MNLKQRITTDESAVSPVIGVILMVAITVILAAVIGTFVLGLGSGQQTNPSAGIKYDPGTTTITVVSVERADKIKACGNKISSPAAGKTIDCPKSPSYPIQVKATYQGKTTVIQTIEKP